MSNEEKILAELKAIRAELATVEARLNNIEMKSVRKEPEPTSAQQLKAVIEMSHLLTDEEKENFGKYMDEIERQKGIIE